MKTTTCRSCGAAIFWVVMESGRRMPVDAELRSMVVVNKDRTKGAVRFCGVSHFTTCPNAAKHRKGGS